MELRQILCGLLLLISIGPIWGQDVRSLNREIASFIDHEEYDKAEVAWKKVLNLQELPQDSLEYAETLHYIGKWYFIVGNYTAAEEALFRSLEIQKRLNRTTDPGYAATLEVMGQLLLDREMFPEAKDHLEKSLAIRKQAHGEHNIEYIETLCYLGRCCLYLGDLETGKKYLDQATLLATGFQKRQVAGVSIKILLFTGEYYYIKGDLQETERQWAKALETSKTYFGENSIHYARSSIMLSTAWGLLGKYKDAEPLLLHALSVYKQKKLVNHPDNLAIYTNLGGIYSVSANYSKAISVLTEALEAIEMILGKESSYYVHSLTSLALAYQYLGQYEVAEIKFIESLQLRKKMYGDESLQFVLTNGNLGILYSDVGNYDKAKEIFEKNLELAKKHNYAACGVQALSGLGGLCDYQNDYINALEYYNEAIKWQEQHYEEDHPYLLTLLKSLATTLNRVNPDPSTEELLLFILQKEEEVYGKGSVSYINTLNRLGEFYYASGKYQDALYYLHSGLELLETSKNYEKYQYTHAFLFSIAAIKEESEKPEEAYPFYSMGFDAIRRETQKNFSFLSEYERVQFLETRNFSFNAIKEYMCEYREHISSASEMAYNTELFHKNLLLTSTTNIQHAILNSGNQKLIDQWREFRSLKEEYIKLSTQGISTDHTNELEERIQVLEKELTRSSNPYSLSQRGYTQTWSDVANNLDKDEAAIEFLSYTQSNAEDLGTQRLYCALLVRPGYASPKIIPCCDENALCEALKEGYTNRQLYSLIWQQLENELEGVGRIYIAPTGLLHHVAFNALGSDVNNCLIDKYTICNVMSTKDIISLKHQNRPQIHHNAVLFGGADYDLTVKEVALTDADIRKQHRQKELMRSVLDDLDKDRGRGFDYLPGSKEEVQAIGEVLTKAQWNISVYTDKEATEARFKSFSSHSPAVMHVSTHGYYFALPETGVEQKNRYKISENPLLRSGLLFSGANRVWNSPDVIVNEGEDGILTAYEIANLNFSGTQLAVLSACDTGRGDIVNNEGTYGLQRAFRLAGVQSMIVSLWKISDVDAVVFMKEFYTGWTAGKQLREAFLSAQKNLRAIYPEHPDKWAGFVLIE